MFEQNLIIFASIGLLGLVIIIFGFKFSDKTRKVVETTGAIIFHVGVFGILYYKVSLNLFISLVTLVISLFILIDPLKIGNYLNAKIYRLFGYLTLFTAVAFSLDYFSGFPVWLWAIPLVIYLSPYLFNPLKKRLKIVLAIAWLVVFSYVALIGYVIYSKYSPQADTTFITNILPQMYLPGQKDYDNSEKNLDYLQKTDHTQTKSLPDVKTISLPDDDKTTEPKKNKIKTVTTKKEPTVKPEKDKPKTVASKLEGPYLKSLQMADEKFLNLQKEYTTLQKKYKTLKQENKDLKKELEDLKEN